MKGKRAFLLLAACVIAGLLFVVGGCGGGDETTTSATQAGAVVTSGQKTYNFKLGHVTQVTHPYHTSIKKWVDDVKAQSNGRINITIYPAAQLGADKTELEAVIAGTQDMGGISLSTFSNYTPVLDAYQLPFLVDDYDLEQKILQDPITRQMLDKLESIGLKGIVIYEGGIRDFLNKKGPVNTPDDIKNMKVRSVPALLLTEIMKSLGTNPVGLPYNQVYTGLQTGLVEGTEMNPSSVFSEKFYEVAKYESDINLFPFPVVVVMSKKAWNSMDAADQELMIKSAEAVIPYSIQINKDLENEQIPQMEAKGLKVNKPADMKPFEDLVAPVYAKWEAKDPLIKQFVDKVKATKGGS